MTYEDIIFKVSTATGVEFKKSINSNSWYGSTELHRIRISDHASKFTEKSIENNFGAAIDLDINYYSTDAIIHLIDNTNPFVHYTEGDIITHSAESVGNTIYISSDYVKKYVEVQTMEGRIVKYDMGKFLGKQNDINNPKSI
jgi:hypothetical protein